MEEQRRVCRSPPRPCWRWSRGESAAVRRARVDDGGAETEPRFAPVEPPCFAKNALCHELLLSVAAALVEAADLAGRCREPPTEGKLRTQSAIDAVAGKLDLGLRVYALLVKTGVLSDASTGPSPLPESDVQELLARLQIGHTEAKHRAVDWLLEALRKDEKSVLSMLGRANVSTMVQLLTESSLVVREKTAVLHWLLETDCSSQCPIPRFSIQNFRVICADCYDEACTPDAIWNSRGEVIRGMNILNRSLLKQLIATHI